MPSIRETGAPYPEAGEGQQRFVISLPSYGDDIERAHLQVQLIAGRFESGDDGDKYVYRGSLQEYTVEGWGYPYWVAELHDLVATRSTPIAQHKDNFIQLADSPVTQYNSKLPIVVYAPAGSEVRYRVWADEAGRKAQAEQPPEAAAPRGGAEDPYREDWENKANGSNEGNPDHLDGTDMYPKEDAAPEQQEDQYRELAPENEPLQPPHQPMALSATEASNDDATQPPEYVSDAHPQTSAIRAAEEEDTAAQQQQQQLQQQQQQQQEAQARAENAKRQARAKAQEEAAKQQQRASVVPLSSTEVSPSKTRASNASPKRSGTDSASEGSPSAGKEKRGSSSSPRKGRNLNDEKYKEL